MGKRTRGRWEGDGDGDGVELSERKIMRDRKSKTREALLVREDCSNLYLLSINYPIKKKGRVGLLEMKSGL